MAIHAPADFTPDEEARYPLNRRLDGIIACLVEWEKSINPVTIRVEVKQSHYSP
jgi:hypothetical protein